MSAWMWLVVNVVALDFEGQLYHKYHASSVLVGMGVVRISSFTRFHQFWKFIAIILLQRTMPAKLYFRYGVVSSAKTLQLLAVSHTYQQQGKAVLLLKPSIDTRFGIETIQSKAGMTAKADIVVDSEFDVLKAIQTKQAVQNIQCILVDECQFLEPKHIDDLRVVATDLNIPVICYGLRTDFRSNLFPGSQRLCEIADTIEEVKTTCHYCNRKAIFNLKHVNGKADFTGPTIQLGAEEKYFPTCSMCYRKAKLGILE